MADGSASQWLKTPFPALRKTSLGEAFRPPAPGTGRLPTVAAYRRMPGVLRHGAPICACGIDAP